MKKQQWKGALAAVFALSVVAAACSSDETTSNTEAPVTTEAPGDTMAPGDTTAPTECTEVTPVKLQLQWVTRAQFAGYYAEIGRAHV